MMRKACKDRFTQEFEFVEVPNDDLYYKDPKRATIELMVEDSGLKRLLFVHRGHPKPMLPQDIFWTASDVETGLAIASGRSAKDAIKKAAVKLQMQDKMEHLVHSAVDFIDQYGRANYALEKPIIREERIIFWHEQTSKLRYAPVAGKRDHIASEGVACLITHHPTAVVNMDDVFYTWPKPGDLCPST